MNASDIKLIVELIPYFGINSERSKRAADRLIRDLDIEGVEEFQDVIGFKQGVLFRVFMLYGMDIRDSKEIDSILNSRCLAIKFHRNVVQPIRAKFGRINFHPDGISSVEEKIKAFETKAQEVGDDLVDYSYLERLLEEHDAETTKFTKAKQLFKDMITVSVLHRKIPSLIRKLKMLSKPKSRANVLH